MKTLRLLQVILYQQRGNATASPFRLSDIATSMLSTVQADSTITAPFPTN